MPTVERKVNGKSMILHQIVMPDGLVIEVKDITNAAEVQMAIQAKKMEIRSVRARKEPWMDANEVMHRPMR